MSQVKVADSIDEIFVAQCGRVGDCSRDRLIGFYCEISAGQESAQLQTSVYI